MKLESQKTKNKCHYWLNHFKNNQNQFDNIDWDLNEKLTSKEISVIKSSIQQFQKGENSEGKHLIQYAKKHGDSTYLETIKLFIKEEQKHAFVLGKFMKIHEIEKIQDHWVDNVFRGMRKLTSLENSILVLLTAEIIASVYYIALRDCINSKILRNICNQILLDEEMHINFQSSTLSRFYKNKSLIGKVFSRLFHRTLMTGTTLIVWFYHRQVFIHGGFSFYHFYQSVFIEYLRSEKIIKEENILNQNENSTSLVQI